MTGRREAYVVRQMLECAKHGRTEHAKRYRGGTTDWDCMKCQSERSKRHYRESAKPHLEQCFEHGMTEHRTYQLQNGHTVTVCVKCKREKGLEWKHAHPAESPTAKNPICPRCFTEKSNTCTCLCDD